MPRAVRRSFSITEAATLASRCRIHSALAAIIVVSHSSPAIAREAHHRHRHCRDRHVVARGPQLGRGGCCASRQCGNCRQIPHCVLRRRCCRRLNAAARPNRFCLASKLLSKLARWPTLPRATCRTFLPRVTAICPSTIICAKRSRSRRSRCRRYVFTIPCTTHPPDTGPSRRDARAVRRPSVRVTGRLGPDCWKRVLSPCRPAAHCWPRTTCRPPDRFATSLHAIRNSRSAWCCATQSATPIARIRIALDNNSSAAELASDASVLHASHHDNPAARSLDLLQAIARKEPGVVRVPAGPRLVLDVEILPWWT